MRRPLEQAECAARLHVSRETSERLATYLDLLRRWQATINLVGASTLHDPWRRHILDSGQLLEHLPPSTRTLVDLGSGAGLPGLVLAVMGVPNVHLIESDRRKATFLREAARTVGTPISVHACRIEAAPAVAAQVLTARALAPVDQLLRLGHRFIGRNGTAVLLKGRTADLELTAARERWTMRAVSRPSVTEPEGTILILDEIERAASA